MASLLLCQTQNETAKALLFCVAMNSRSRRIALTSQTHMLCKHEGLLPALNKRHDDQHLCIETTQAAPIPYSTLYYEARSARPFHTA